MELEILEPDHRPSGSPVAYGGKPSFDFSTQDDFRFLLNNTQAQLSGHLLGVILVEVELLRNLVGREIQAHQVYTENPGL